MQLITLIMMWSAKIRDSQFFLVQLRGRGVTVPLFFLSQDQSFFPQGSSEP